MRRSELEYVIRAASSVLLQRVGDLPLSESQRNRLFAWVETRSSD